MNDRGARLARAMGSPRRKLRGGRRGERGQTLVEFALIMPVFLILLFGLADFGRGFYAYLIVTNAAREGARSAAVRDDAATIDNKVYSSFCSAASPPSGCAIGPSGISITRTNVQGTKGSEAKVQVSYVFTFVTPIGTMLSIIGGSNLTAPTITSTTSMRLE